MVRGEGGWGRDGGGGMVRGERGCGGWGRNGEGRGRVWREGKGW